jgi:hypothetical protein
MPKVILSIEIGNLLFLINTSMRIYELRDPSKGYYNLDNQFRNQFKNRRDSAGAPGEYEFDLGDETELQTPSIDTEKSEKQKQKEIKKTQQKKNQPTKVDDNFYGNTLNHMPYQQIIQYVKGGETVKEFINKFELAFGQQFTTTYRVDGWDRNTGTVNGNISCYILTDNDVRLELIIGSSDRKDSARKDKTIDQVKINKIRLNQFTTNERKEKVKLILSNPEYGGYKFTDKITFLDIAINPPTSVDDAIKQLQELAETIESMGDNFDIPVTKKEKTSSSDHTYDYYNWLARNLFSSWLNGVPSAFSRGGGESRGGYDLKDDMIVIGITKGGMKVRDELKLTPYREHAVPCDTINNIGIDICEKMFGEYKQQYQKRKSIENSPKFIKESRRTIFVLRQMIQRCLVLVLTSVPERKYIDFTKGWLSTMPSKDWDWKTGDVLERFKKSKIAVYHIDDISKRLSEEKK